MSATTPDDLAVSYQSLARRRREAIGDANPAIVGGLVAELQTHVDAAAAALSITGDGDAVAAVIRSRATADWDDATLETLRQHALDAGAVLRRIADAVESAADD